MRDTFDYFLLKRAIRAGANIRDETTFVSLYGKAGNLTIETPKANLQAKIIVGADGVNSRVSRALGLRVKKKRMTAIAAEVFLKNPNRLKKQRRPNLNQ